MAVVIVQRPDPISLTGNIKELVIQSEKPVGIILTGPGGKTLEETYYPGNGNLMHIGLREVIEADLSFTLPSSDVFIQPRLSGFYKLSYNSEAGSGEIQFTAIRAGKLNLTESASSFLTGNFLTWQPNCKPVVYYSPEWLTYFAPVACYARLKAYWEDGTNTIVQAAQFSINSCITMNMQYAVVVGKFNGKRPMYYDVWIEDTTGKRLSYVQRYIASERLGENEQWYLFENSLGGLDSLRAYGSIQDVPEYTHHLSERGNESEEYRVDVNRLYTRNTGYLTPDEARWLQDLFPARRKYMYALSGLLPIVLTESEGHTDSTELPSSYTFTYRLADTRPYLDIQRRTDLPENLKIPIPTGETFFLPPRLAEFPKPVLSPDLLIPVEEPHTEVWGATSIGAIHDAVLNDLIRDLDGLDLNPVPSGGGQNVEIIKLNDLTIPSDENIFSSLRSLKEIKDANNGLLVEINDMFLRKDVDDNGAGFYTWEQGWMTKSPIRSAEYNIGWEIENPTGWYVSETGVAWYSSMNVRGAILSNGVIGSPYYVSGWTGYGSQWDMVNHRLETDYISVRKELKVYALDVFRIYGTNGDLAVSTTNKIDRVEDMGSAWRCYIDTYDGEMYMNMRIDDVVKCQTWEKLSGRYYMARVTNIDEKWFELSKTLLDGTTTPASGDIVVRWSNLTNNDRKGLLYLSASDSYAPYMDVRFGDWNATVGTIKVRNGRLDGINDPLFPELYGAVNNFGLYTSNFYGTGELILRSTGESVSRTFEVLKDSIKMGLDEVRYEIQVSQGSVLLNPAFQEGISSWEVTNVYYPWIINNSLLQSNYKPFMNFVSGALVVTDEVINRPALQVADATVIQRNALFTTKTKGKYSLRFSYRSLLPFGSLEIGVPGSQLNIKVNLSDNTTYQKGEIAADWDGTGDFTIKVNGVVNISDISFVDDKLTNAINEVKTYYDTKLTFYAEKAVMDSFREEYDEFNRVVKKDYATQTWTYNTINTEVGTIVNGKLTNYSTTTQTAQMINNKVADLNLGQYATTNWTSSQITSSVRNLASVSYVNQKADSLTVSISSVDSKANKNKDITEAFYKFGQESMQLNRRIEVGPVEITGYVAQGGLSPNVDNILLWGGGAYWQARDSVVGVVLRHDGSGYFAKKNIYWDTSGNATFRGVFETSLSGYRTVIGTDGRFRMYNNSVELLNFGYFIYEGTYYYPSLNMYRKSSSGEEYASMSLDVTTLIFAGGATYGARYMAFNLNSFPISPLGLSKGTVYRDGNVLKIVTG